MFVAENPLLAGIGPQVLQVVDAMPASSHCL
jgi:hypothetical protein